MPDFAELKTTLLAMLGDGEVRSILRNLLGVEERDKEIADLKEQVAGAEKCDRRPGSAALRTGTVFQEELSQLHGHPIGEGGEHGAAGH